MNAAQVNADICTGLHDFILVHCAGAQTML